MLPPTSLAEPPRATSAAQQLAGLKSRPRKPGEASFFWHDAHFGCAAVKVLPGEYFVDRDNLMIVTTLGSCIAACLWDGSARIGGMNHFMLPDNSGGSGDHGRFGAYAMEVLINELLKQGARRGSLEAKVFGGGRVIAGMDSINVGERNTQFVIDYLRTERIPLVSKDVLDIYPRKVCFLPATGKAMVKRLAHAHEATQRERELVKTAPAGAAGGTVDLF